MAWVLEKKLQQDKNNRTSCLALVDHVRKIVESQSERDVYLDKRYSTECDEFEQLIKRYNQCPHINITINNKNVDNVYTSINLSEGIVNYHVYNSGRY